MPPLPIVPPPDEFHRAAAAVADGTRPDIAGDADIHAVLHAFYEVVPRDPLLERYFVAVDMEAHLPRIVDFWSTMLFHSGRYQGNAFRPHLAMPGLEARHFARWVEVLEATVDARHAGPVAERMKELAHRVAYSMQLRLGITPFAPFRSDAEG